MEGFWQDLRYAIRVVIKNRGLSLAAVVALALGIGANTAIFSIFHAVLLRPLPFKDPDRLVLLWQINPRSGWPQVPFSFPNFTDVKEQSQVFESIAAWRSFADTRFNLTGQYEPVEVQAAYVSASFFSTLGVEPLMGRAFLPDEEREGGDRVVVISHGLWQRHFGADRSIIGRPLTLDGTSYTVVGIMPPGFTFPRSTRPAEVWVALSRDPDPTLSRKYARGATYLGVVARLKLKASLQQAQAEEEIIARRLEQQFPHFLKGWGVRVVPLRTQVVGDLREALLVLLGAVGFVLLIACANVANLLLAHATMRQKEIAIRAALGAGRLRIVRQLLAESVLLALLGGAFGLLLSLWGIDLLAAIPSTSQSPFVPYQVSREEIGLNGQVLCFTLALSLLTGIIFGMAPALQASKPDLNQTLKEGTLSRAAGNLRASNLGGPGVLVVSEIALSLVLVIGAGLMLKSYMRLLEIEPGFNPANVLTAEINLPRSKYSSDEQVVTIQGQMLVRLQSLPGVEAVGSVSSLPLSGSDAGSDFFIENQPAPAPDRRINTHHRTISPDYFRAMGIPMVQGRSFTERDSRDTLRVAIINEGMARRFWPGENPVGKRLALSNEALRFVTPNRPPQFDIPSAMREIVGVVKDVRHFGLDAEPKPEMYIPYSQRPTRDMTLVVRSAIDPSRLAEVLRREVLAIDKDQPVSNVRTMSQLLSDSVAKPRANFTLMGLFAALALILASVGIYGVMSYSVTQRTREIGIRMALGAQAGDVLRIVVGQGIVLALAGMLIGLAAAFALTPLMSSLLYGVSATDAATFSGVSLLLMSVAFVAAYIPARRATKVDPMVALRYQ